MCGKSVNVALLIMHFLMLYYHSLSLSLSLSLPMFSCVLSPVVSKASSGAMEMMTVFSLSDMPDFLSVSCPYSPHMKHIVKYIVLLHSLHFIGCTDLWLGGSGYLQF